MIRAALAGVLLFACGARGAETPSDPGAVLARARGVEARMKTWVADLERARAREAGTDPSLADPSALEHPPLHAACLALAEANPAPCASARGAGSREQAERDCRETYSSLRALKAWTSRAPDAQRECREWARRAEVFGPGRVAEACRILAPVPGPEVPALCARLTPLTNGVDPLECRHALRSLFGLDECAEQPTKLYRAACAARRGIAGTGPCASPLCRAAEGGGKEACRDEESSVPPRAGFSPAAPDAAAPDPALDAELGAAARASIAELDGLARSGGPRAAEADAETGRLAALAARGRRVRADLKRPARKP